ncbi:MULTISPECIES: phosphorylase family protein [Azotobacter]|nr:purine and other phosphorylase-like protein, family 1 [Azotobacter vinelandii]GLK60298.1 hypothetical protein GCM10017624_24580 [Azotobacter vinelandii]SFY14662.1 hopanoid-associated phosphorylase [Azotobacter vinelandii]
MSLYSAGIVVALKVEAEALTAKSVRPECLMPLADGCVLWLSGMGPEAARKAAQALADAGAGALATFGVAGALDAGLRSGTLLCPHGVLDGDGRTYMTDPAWCGRLRKRLASAGLPVVSGITLLSSCRALSTPEAKMAAHSRYAAAAVDMESAAVAAVAADRNLPFATLRAIVDERDDALPEALQAAIGPWGQPQLPRLIATLARRPWLLSRLPRLSSCMDKALRALRAAAKAAPNLEAPAALQCGET